MSTFRFKRAFLLAVVALAGGLAFAAPAASVVDGGRAALPDALWAVDLGRNIPSSLSALRGYRARGFNVLVADSRRVPEGRIASLRSRARRVELVVIAPRAAPPSSCAALRRRNLQCALVAPSVAAATRLARSGVDVVVVRLRTVSDLRYLRGRSRGRILALARFHPRRFDTAAWKRAIAIADQDPHLDLGIIPTGPRLVLAARRFGDLRRAVTKRPSGGGGGGGGPTSTASVFVAPSGSDSNPCSQTQPCASFSRAYSAAAAGATVQVAAGTYGRQGINATPKAGPDVVFRPASGANVTVDSIDITRAAHIEFRDLTVTRSTYSRPNAQWITYRRIKMRQFFIRGADHIRYVDSEVGPNVSDSGMNWITAAYQTNDASSDVLLDGVRIHDFKKWSGSAHVDCIGIDDVNGLVIRNTRIWNCEHFSLIFGKDLWSDRAARNVLLENNFFDCCHSGYYSIGLGDVEGPMTVRFNSFTLGLGWLGGSVRNVTIDSNVISNNSSANCSNATWRHNVVASGATCGGIRAATGFRAKPDDLHLNPGAAAIDAGNPASFPSTDIDGQRRPAGRRPDAGADER